MASRPRLRARTATAFALAAGLLAHPASAREDGEAPRRTAVTERSGLSTPEQEAGIDRALAWIASRQQPGGMWGDEKGTRVADTALCLLALMAGGNTVGPPRPLELGGDGSETLRGRHARSVRDGLRYLCSVAWSKKQGKPRGYIADDQKSRMHGHGFALLALSQAVGNLGARDVREIRTHMDPAAGRSFSELTLADQVRWSVELAVRVTESAQDPDTGGWLYQPVPEGHEGSMTVTQVTALRAAADTGVAVDAAVMRRAYDYIRQSQNRGDRALYGGFAYQMNQKNRVSYGLTAAALTSLFGLGRYGDKEGDAEMIELGLDYLDRTFEEHLHPSTQWFYYNLFYGAQAVYLSADTRRISRHWPRIRDTVLALQDSSGAFSEERDHDAPGPEYSTAMGALILQVPLETLPVLQRR